MLGKAIVARAFMLKNISSRIFKHIEISIAHCSTMTDMKKVLYANDKHEFIRKPSTFRQAVSSDPAAEFPAEPGRYHLYVSKACPWAHRTLISRKLKGLEDVISVDVVYWKFSEVGWMFSPDKPGCTPDTVNGLTYMRDIYLMADKNFEGRYTVPVLWDKKSKTIVNNESSEIIRMFNTEFNQFCSTPEHQKVDLYPVHSRKEIDELNEWIYKYVTKQCSNLTLW